MREYLSYAFYALTDRQVLDILRTYEQAKFIPMNPCHGIISNNVSENSFIYSYAVAKFQDLITLEDL